jgi:hypothetical protein
LATTLEEKDRRLFFEILFETPAEATWEAAESCMSVLRNRQVGQELAELQRKIEAAPSAGDLQELLIRKEKLLRLLSREMESSKTIQGQ